jgi:hypothetical protein
MAKVNQAIPRIGRKDEDEPQVSREQWEADMLRVLICKMRWTGADVLLGHVRVGGRPADLTRWGEPPRRVTERRQEFLGRLALRRPVQVDR